MILSNITELAQRRRLVLASRSPRRRDLLSQLGLSFAQVIPSVNEKRNKSEEPCHFACRLAEMKALAVSAGMPEHTQSIVIGCDTVVVLAEVVFGKPRNKIEAIDTLERLSGKSHVVSTAVALALAGKIVCSGYDSTIVHFNQVSHDQIVEYVASGEPLDKAGAYGIQGMGGFLVDSIEGNLDTVIGLPCVLLDQMAGRILADAEVLLGQK